MLNQTFLDKYILEYIYCTYPDTYFSTQAASSLLVLNLQKYSTWTYSKIVGWIRCTKHLHVQPVI